MIDFSTIFARCLTTGECFDETVNKFIRSQMEKTMNEIIRAEQTSILKYNRYERAGQSQRNSRNGSYERKMNTSTEN